MITNQKELLARRLKLSRGRRSQQFRDLCDRCAGLWRQLPLLQLVQPPHDEHVDQQVIEQGRSVDRIVTPTPAYLWNVRRTWYSYQRTRFRPPRAHGWHNLPLLFTSGYNIWQPSTSLPNPFYCCSSNACLVCDSTPTSVPHSGNYDPSTEKVTLSIPLAVLFDIDGTLVNSDPIRYAVFRELLLQQDGFNNNEPIDEAFFRK